MKADHRSPLAMSGDLNFTLPVLRGQWRMFGKGVDNQICVSEGPLWKPGGERHHRDASREALALVWV